MPAMSEALGVWEPGKVVLLRQYLGRAKAPQLINVLPEIVVHDGPDYLALLSQPGMTFATRDVPGRNAMSVDERIELYKREELNHDWYERTVSRSVLSFFVRGVAHSIRVFWDPGWRFRYWYVNLEDPYVRTRRAIGVNDHTLDIVANLNLEWSWKDEPEFEALVAAGRIRPEKARLIRAEGLRVIERIEARSWPFDEPWPAWRPDPSWPVPQIGGYWSPPAPAGERHGQGGRLQRQCQ
jgi:hypothetical protein